MNMNATMQPPVTAAAPDFVKIKAKQQETWAAGDYAAVGTLLQIVGEDLCEAVDVRAGERVLDVAAGNGNASLAAARRFGEVTSTDYVAILLDRGRERARADGLAITFRQADAENLPFADGTFDVVLSTFGVMFTPDQDKAAAEMMRVTRSGGRIGLANWTPDSFVGHIFKTIGKHLPPPAGLKSPAMWGMRHRVTELFGEHAARIDTTAKRFTFRYRSADHWLEHFRTNYGPMLKAFAALDADRQTALAADLIALAGTFNVATDGTMVVPSEYLEVVVARR